MQKKAALEKALWLMQVATDLLREAGEDKLAQQQSELSDQGRFIRDIWTED